MCPCVTKAEGLEQEAAEKGREVMKRVGMIASFVFAGAALLLPATASAQQCYPQYYASQPYTYGYSYGYYGTPSYRAYSYDWRDDRRDHKWREREERREREWRRHERREHDRWDRKHWRDRDDWRH